MFGVGRVAGTLQKVLMFICRFSMKIGLDLVIVKVDLYV